MLLREVQHLQAFVFSCTSSILLCWLILFEDFAVFNDGKCMNWNLPHVFHRGSMWVRPLDTFRHLLWQIKLLQAHSSATFMTPKSGKFHFWMATTLGAYMLSTSLWLIIMLPVEVKTYRFLKIEFYGKVKNEVHVTISHVCDFSQNYGPAPHYVKVKILWHLMEFCIEQYTDDGKHFWNSIIRISFDAVFFGKVCDILV